MSLREFVRREGRLDPALLTLDAWQTLDDEADGEGEPNALAAAPPDAVAALPRASQRALFGALRRYRSWRREVAALVDRRSVSGLPAPPPEALDATLDTTGVRAVERALVALPAASTAEDGLEAAVASLLAAFDLWNRCLALTRADGSVRAAVREGHAAAEEFADHADTSHRLDGLPPHRWLALSRGERMGALHLTFELPTEEMAEQLALARPALECLPADRSPASLLQELVIEPLPGELRRILDEEAAEAAIAGAVREYGELLTSSPIGADRVGGVYIGGPRRPIGLAVVDGGGQLVSSARIAPTEGWPQRVASWLASEGARHVAVPTQSPSAAQITELRRVLAAADKGAPTLVAVRPAALAEARQAFLEGGRRVTAEAAAAAVVAQRAAVPAQAWAAVDPVGLGLAEYQSDLDEEALREALGLERILSQQATLRRAERGPVAPAAGGRAPSTLVRSLQDLRPGMVVPAVVTNVTHFGAFVDIGLSQQGLIHVSDLADHFVQDPSEVVRPGQQLQARVLGVDPSRGRISLTLRSETRPRGSRDRDDSGPRGPRGGGGSRPRGGGGDRQRALRDLEKLFDR